MDRRLWGARVPARERPNNAWIRESNQATPQKVVSGRRRPYLAVAGSELDRRQTHEPRRAFANVIVVCFRSDGLLRRSDGAYERVPAGERLDAPVDYLEFGVFSRGIVALVERTSALSRCPILRVRLLRRAPGKLGKGKKGTFDTGRKVPNIDDARVQFVVGLFQDTLVPFLRQTPLRRRKIIHMDADLYTSTLYVLAQLVPHICPGDIIIFDEFGSIRTAQDAVLRI